MKKKLKGMTLLEVIIAMVVMVIGAALLVQSAVGIINVKKTSRTVVNLVNSQSPVVENQAVINSVEITDAVETGELGNILDIRCGAVTGSVAVKKYHAPAVTTIVSSTDDEGNVVSSVKTVEPKSGNLKYFVLS